MEQQRKWPLATAGALVVVYSVAVLGFVATSPDLRLRCLMVDEPDEHVAEQGVQIRATPDIVYSGFAPQPGDVLLRIRDQRVWTFLDFINQLSLLRNEPIPAGGKLYRGADPSELTAFSIPSLVEVGEGSRWVRTEILPRGESESQETWLLVQSLPLRDLVLSQVWFVLQLGVFVLGALAFWNRPFDRASRLFFAMCIVTLGSFVGGYHWWVVAESLWLSIPYVVCSLLVPVVSLHFFLVFPRARAVMVKRPTGALIALYGLPVVTIGGILWALCYASWLHDPLSSETSVESVLGVLRYLRRGIYTYFLVATGFYLAALLVVHHSYRTSRNSTERGQLRWIWGAGIVSGVFVALTLYLALFHRAEFALGTGRIPMFLASLSFMLAYTVGIIRYRLMLIDQIFSKGMLYYAFKCALTVLFCLAIALSTLVPQLLNISLSPQQTLSVAIVLMLPIVLLLWLRDLFQQAIDRQFFREKYQLGKALQRMNRAIRHLADPESLAEMMVRSCRDVLGVSRAALYLRSSTNGPFQLIASVGCEDMPFQFYGETAIIHALTESGSLQRVTLGSRSEASAAQILLRDLNAGLIHPLEVDRGVTGLVILGEKNNSAFTAEDLTFLNALGQITNVALHSAKMDREISRLNEELRLKVDEISDQGRQLAILQMELGDTQQDSRAVPKLSDRSDFRRDCIIGNGVALRNVLETARKVATSESSVLIRGESGTGKELLAQVLHDNGPRKGGPLVTVHCAALSPSLLESELFGHVKGSFTGAHRDKIGRFEMASGGTLFLDEIGDISLETQVKLLRVLQERCFEPVGSSETLHVDVRLLTATHQDLEKLITAGRFREDLYYRLNVISITLPPLRERTDDIFDLALHFLNQSSHRIGKRFTDIEKEAFDALVRYRWPGNIRELQNAIERSVVLADGGSISLDDLPSEIRNASSATLPKHVVETKSSPPLGLSADDGRPSGGILSSNEEPSERELLEAALRQCAGNKAQAARLLGMPRSTYYSKLKKHLIN